MVNKIVQMKKTLSGRFFVHLLLGLSLLFTALASRFSKSFSVRIINLHVAIAPEVVFIGCPGKRSLYCSSWLPGLLKQIKYFANQSLLHRNIPWFPAWIPKREINKQKSRHPAFLHIFTCRTDYHGTDSFGLKMTGNQTLGLVADWSKRDQDGNVHSVFFTPVEDQWCIKFPGLTLAVGRRCTIIPGRNFANLTRLLKILQAVQWQIGA